jgi:malonyl CoA-acyl carrier protein transacylase
MKEANENLRNYIEDQDFSFKNAKVPIIANTLTKNSVDPMVITKEIDIKNELANQMDHPVLWSQTIKKIVEEYNAKRLIIFGPGKKTQKIISDEYPEVKVCIVEDLQTLKETIYEVKHPGEKMEEPSEDSQPEKAIEQGIQKS